MRERVLEQVACGVCACVKLWQQRGPPKSFKHCPVLRKLCIRRPTLSSHCRLHQSPPISSASFRPLCEALSSKAASPRRRRLCHLYPLPALHQRQCSHAPHIAAAMRRHPTPRMLLLLVEQALPATAVALKKIRANLKLHAAARGAAGGAAAPHAAPAFGLQKLARFAGEGAKGGRASGGERRR